MNVALISTYYPNKSDPFRAVFVRNLAVAMARRAHIEVVAPVPYAPPWPYKAEWQALRAIPANDEQHGISVAHPRFAILPKLGSLTGLTYALGARDAIRKLKVRGYADIIHAHCAYPDGVGAALIAKQLRLPLVITAHGSDINVYAQRTLERLQVRAAISRASCVIAVSLALRARICEIAPEYENRVVHVPCSGFDPTVFAPGNRQETRAQLGISATAKVALFVGQLVPIKALDQLTRAWLIALEHGTLNQDARLLLIGDGPMRSGLEKQAAGSRDTIQVLGPRTQGEIAGFLRASDLLCLPSHIEGTPNVIVEAFATGIPVLATAVGGIPELVTDGVNGVLVPPRDVAALVAGLERALTRNWDTAQITRSAAGYTWTELAERNIDLLAAATSGNRKTGS